MRRLTAEDRTAIAELYSRYNLAADSDDLTLWAGCFTDDVVTIRNGVEIRRGLDAHVDQRRADPLAGRRQHWNNNLVLDRVDDLHARGRCYLMVVDLSENGEPPAITVLGSYVDLIRKVDGEWKFAERVITYTYPKE